MKKSTPAYMGINIDYSRDRLIPEIGMALLTGKGFFKKEDEESPQETLARAATCYSFGDKEFAQRIYDYVSKQHAVFASPAQTNAVLIDWPEFTESQFKEAGDWLEKNVTPSGMPISCFLSYIPDNKEGLVETRAEASWLSMSGGGLGIYMGNRSPDEKSTGAISHLRGYDADAVSYRQTESRRGSIAAYMDYNHPEIMTFTQMRNPVGGEQNRKCFNLNSGTIFSDSVMRDVIEGRSFELVDPKHGPTGTKIPARELFENTLDMRFETGEPYCMFGDTVNRNIRKWITNPNYRVRQSNLCAEITLYTSEKRTAVCCLSSLNLEKYDEWKDSNIVSDMIRLLDNILEYFIRLAPPTLARAVYSAKKERAVGLGTMGWHSFLQSKMIPFESGGVNSAVHWTHIIYGDIEKRAIAESKRLGGIRGEPDDCAGSGMRNSHLLAIAPNATSSSIVGASPSIEPWNANAFIPSGRAGAFIQKNKYLMKILEEYGLNTDEVWLSIASREGSIKHLDLPEEIKNIFKTSFEIDNRWIIELAAARQKYLCQSQSVNLFIHPDMSKHDFAELHLLAWYKGLKTLYYCRVLDPNKASVGNGGSSPLNSVPVKTMSAPITRSDDNECLACHA